MLVAAISMALPAAASETITYSYDALGRLIQVARSGSVNNGASASYSYDPANNRTNVAVSGVSGPPSFSINDVAVTEGGSLVFTVTKTGTTSTSYSVNYATANGTATAGSDYTAASSTLTFAAADITKTVTIATIDDTTAESSETVLVNLSGATGGATISDAQGIGTINDNDTAPTCSGISFTIASNGAVTEGTNSAFTITKSGTTSNSCSVSYATAGGTATAGSDYTSASGALTFTSAQTSQVINVATTDDTEVESAETFTMTLSSPTGGATLGTPNSATATINDNDSAPSGCTGVSFAVSDASADEGVSLQFTVTKTGSTSSSCGVNYATADGIAVQPADYTAKSGALTFSSAQTSLTVSVTTILNADTIAEETMYLNLSSSGDGSTISDPQGIGTIYWADPNPCPLC